MFAVILIGFSLWQSRHLLESDGSIHISPQKLVSLEGETKYISQNGKKTLVYFFAPWCTVCAVSIGNLEYVDEQDVNVVRIALDYRSQQDVEKFVRDNNVSGEILIGTEELKSQFNIMGYPTYYLLDENNIIVASSFGYSTAIGLKLTNFLHAD